MDTTIFVGLDVHKKTIAVATVEARVSADVRFYGTIPNTPEAIRSMLRKLAKGGQRLHLTYEAGPLGYNLYRLSTGLGHRCDVVAPLNRMEHAGKIGQDRHHKLDHDPAAIERFGSPGEWRSPMCSMGESGFRRRFSDRRWRSTSSGEWSGAD